MIFQTGMPPKDDRANPRRFGGEFNFTQDALDDLKKLFDIYSQITTGYPSRAINSFFVYDSYFKLEILF